MPERIDFAFKAVALRMGPGHCSGYVSSCLFDQVGRRLGLGRRIVSPWAVQDGRLRSQSSAHTLIIISERAHWRLLKDTLPVFHE